MRKNVLVLLPVEARHKEKLEAAGAGCCFAYSNPDTVTVGQIQAANIILGLPKADMLKASKNLEWLQLASCRGRMSSCPSSPTRRKPAIFTRIRALTL